MRVRVRLVPAKFVDVFGEGGVKEMFRCDAGCKEMAQRCVVCPMR